MAGTIIITGANGSLAIPAIEYLLRKYPDFTPILTVRNVSADDVNTNKLRSKLAKFPDNNVSIIDLDLADLSTVHEFARSTAAKIAAGTLPALAAIVCNAYYWNLAQGVQFTNDGFEKSFQVSHLAHVALVLRLLSTFAPEGGRVVLLSSDAHWPGKNSLEKYPPALPENLDLLVKPIVSEAGDNFGHGFQRYANSKLAVVTWMHALNYHLVKCEDPKLNRITAVAINPGNLSDSRALQTNTPAMLYYLSKFIIRPLRPLFRLMDPTMRTAAEAGADVIDLAMENVFPRQRGYFTLLKEDESAPESRDIEKQQKLWEKSAEWVKIIPKSVGL